MNELSNYIASHPVPIAYGKHDSPECGICILELCSLALGVKWTDRPDILELPDIRRINDAKWCDAETRTREMLRLGVAIWPWRTATDEQRIAFARRLSELTIRRVLPPMLKNVGLHAEADRCEREGSEASANSAAYASTYAAAYAAVYATYASDAYASTYAAANAAAAAAFAYTTNSAAYASTYAAANAAASAASTEMLIIAVDCWVEAAAELTEDGYAYARETGKGLLK